MQDYWHKQTTEQPLFPNLLWSRPENRQFAGKLLIVGGSAHGFAAPAEAYAQAEKAGVGVARVMLPDALTKTVGKLFPEAEFAPSTPSGSYSQKALGELLPAASWADGVLLAGDFGRNSETAILLEKLAQKYTGQLTLAGDTIDYLLTSPNTILQRQQTLLSVSFSQLQKLFSAARSPRPITSDMDLTRFIEALHLFSLQHHAYIITVHQNTLFVCVEGKISTTPSRNGHSVTAIAASASVWWLQNPDKPFQALSVSVVA